jgi:Putative adhesin
MKKHILKAAYIFVISALILITPSIMHAQDPNEFVVPLSDPAKRGKVKARINYGSITVKGTGRKDVLVKYTAEQDEEEKRDATKDGLRRIGGGGMDLEVTENGNVVKVSSDSWNNKLNLEIEVPSGMDLEVKTYNDGDLIVTNIQGEVELTNYNGEITALNISGSVVATTYNGGIKITFDKIMEGTPMSYSTFNGDIDITFPSTLKATMKMKTEQGDIYAGFDVDFKSSGPVQKKDTKSGVYKVVIDEWKRGDINGGGPEITLKNYNGDIYIRKK